MFIVFFFFNDTATTEIYTLSLYDALPISHAAAEAFLTSASSFVMPVVQIDGRAVANGRPGALTRRLRQLYLDMAGAPAQRSEEHTSELQSRQYLVCRLLLEKKKKATNICI